MEEAKKGPGRPRKPADVAELHALLTATEKRATAADVRATAAEARATAAEARQAYRRAALQAWRVPLPGLQGVRN